MSQDKMTYEDLLQLVELIKASEQFADIHVKVGDMEVTMRRGGAPGVERAESAPAVAIPPAALPTSAPAVPAPAPAVAKSAVRAPETYPEGSVLIRSPMVGTFYRAPQPGAQPFTDVDQRVDSDTTVCIIEVMKLMNSIPANCRGTVTQILVADAAPVEYGQVLMVIRPD